MQIHINNEIEQLEYQLGTVTKQLELTEQLKQQLEAEGASKKNSECTQKLLNALYLEESIANLKNFQAQYSQRLQETTAHYQELEKRANNDGNWQMALKRLRTKVQSRPKDKDLAQKYQALQDEYQKGKEVLGSKIWCSMYYMLEEESK